MQMDTWLKTWLTEEMVEALKSDPGTSKSASGASSSTPAPAKKNDPDLPKGGMPSSKSHVS